MRSLITAKLAATLVAIAIGVATLPAAAQTPPTPGACPAPGCDSADHAYGDGGAGFTDSGAMGDILFGDGVDLSELGIAPPPQDSEDSSPEDSEDSSPGNSGANGGASDSASENGGGMTAEEYADHMDSNAQQWDDLADQAADPADAAGWRQRAADLRAEAARARLQAARDAVSVSVSDGGAQAPLIGLLGPPDEAIIGNLYGLRLPADPDNLGYDALNITAEILFGTFFAARHRSLGPPSLRMKRWMRQQLRRARTLPATPRAWPLTSASAALPTGSPPWRPPLSARGSRLRVATRSRPGPATTTTRQRAARQFRQGPAQRRPFLFGAEAEATSKNGARVTSVNCRPRPRDRDRQPRP